MDKNKKHFDLMNAISPPPPETDFKEENIYDKMFELIYSDDNIELKTDLNPRQILAITRCDMYSQIFDLPIVKDLTNKFERLQLSNARKSRKEFTEISKSINNPMGEIGDPTLSEKLFGKR